MKGFAMIKSMRGKKKKQIGRKNLPPADVTQLTICAA